MEKGEPKGNAPGRLVAKSIEVDMVSVERSVCTDPDIPMSVRDTGEW